MAYLLRHSHFSESENAHPAAGFTKHFQHLEADRVLKDYYANTEMAGEIGSCIRFDSIVRFLPGRRAVIDPYNRGPGAGAARVPDFFPQDTRLFRCLVGQDSSLIPDRMFDVTFSISVLEHIGQAEANYACHPTDDPPAAQEILRDSFCAELFRITRPGGITFHTVDHAARNLSFIGNFLKAGFVVADRGSTPTVAECLDDPDAVRQKYAWGKPDEPMPPERQRLNSVLVLMFKRPSRWRRLWPF